MNHLVSIQLLPMGQQRECGGLKAIRVEWYIHNIRRTTTANPFPRVGYANQIMT